MAVIEAKEEWRRSPRLEFSDPPSSAGVYCVSYGLVFHLVKIGRTNNIAKRLQNLRTGAPGGVALRAILSLDPDDETMFHKRFEQHRVDREWFDARLLDEL